MIKNKTEKINILKFLKLKKVLKLKKKEKQ